MVVRRKYQVRVISGDFKGRVLRYPTGRSLRPTMQRIKSSVFESLGDRIRGAVFVDLYAAAGAMGIEALSRGARLVHFVEKSPTALRFLQRNLEACRVDPGRYRVHPVDVAEFVERGRLRPIGPDIVYADPPYERTDFAVLLEFLEQIVYPAPVLIAIEHPSHAAVAPGDRLVMIRKKSFGQTCVTFLAGGEGDAG